MSGPTAVGFQGTEGCYSHLAGTSYYEAAGVPVAFRGFLTFRDLLEAVRDGQIDEAVLPVENTTAGSVHEAADLLGEMDLSLIGEAVWKVEHVLLGLRPTPLDAVRRVRSHPQALAQCARFLRTLPNATIEPWADTAMACEAVARDGDPTGAAVASEHAGRLSGLVVLARDIANQEGNYTRFVVVARSPRPAPAGASCRTTIVFATRHEHGALARCLDLLARHGLNLTRIESRPLPGRPWEYRFLVDFEGNAAEEPTAKALCELGALCVGLRVLGSYEAAPRPA